MNKKHTLALSLFTLLAASSASAYTVLDNKETGTKIDFSGSARLVWKSTSGTEHINHAVANNGSRFGFKINQQLGNDFYALGGVQWRFRGTSSSQHNFDDIYTRDLYAGFGHKKFGELTYGHQAVITDEIKQTDLAHTLSLSDELVMSHSRKTTQYVYKGIENLKAGVFYGAGSRRNSSGLDLANKRKDTWGAGAIYNHVIDSRNNIKFGAGFSRERFYNADSSVFSSTGYKVGAAYTIDNTTVAVDLARNDLENRGAAGNKTTEKQLTAAVLQQLTDQWSVYGMYAHKTKDVNATSNTKSDAYLIGSSYYIIPTYLKTFVEWKTEKSKTNGVKNTRNNTTVVGLRAFW